MIELIQMDTRDLRRLAAFEPVDLGIAIPDGALPPVRVAVRALAQLDAGTPALWCIPFLIVPQSREMILGGCGFKTAPVNGRVEISYGVARDHRGRGVATAAVSRLLQLARASGEVEHVVARILPENLSSTKLVESLGFSRGEALVDHDGKAVVEWTLRIAP